MVGGSVWVGVRGDTGGAPGSVDLCGKVGDWARGAGCNGLRHLASVLLSSIVTSFVTRWARGAGVQNMDGPINMTGPHFSTFSLFSAY